MGDDRNMKKVLLRGPLLTASGYGEHARQFYRWLESREDIDLKVQCLNWGHTTWYIDTNIENGLIGRIMSKTNFDIEKEYFDISIQIQLPDEWDPKLAKYNIGVSAFIETNKCTDAWAKCCNKMDKVIVPSNHAKKGILENGSTNTPIIVVNEPYNPLILEEDKNFNIDFETDFNFLIVSQLTDRDPEGDRKNIENTIRNFCKNFKNNKNVGLVIKTNVGRSTIADRNVTQKMLENIIKTSREGLYPRVYMIHGLLTPNEMSRLYTHEKIKGLISLTRGEGYGLPMLEASVLGLPVIATNWSGHLDFLKNFTKIDFNLVTIPDSKVDNRMFERFSFWANPKMEDFKQKTELFIKNYNEIKKEAKKEAKNNRTNFSQGRFNSIMNEILK